MRKSPVELVVTEVETLVAVLTARTEAATTTAPEGSLTRPWIWPRESCEKETRESARAATRSFAICIGGFYITPGGGWWGKTEEERIAPANIRRP